MKPRHPNIMGLRTADIIATVILNLIHCTVIHCAYTADHILSCNVTAVEPCPGDHQICEEASSTCVCMKGYTRVGDGCEVPAPADASGHGATAAVVTIFTLALVICGLALVVRKYNLVDYARQRINLRRNNDVMYEDVMIGQDDPPLNP